MRRGWELVLLLVIFGVIIRQAVMFIEPLVPYMLVAGLVGLVAAGYWRRNRTW